MHLDILLPTKVKDKFTSWFGNNLQNDSKHDTIYLVDIWMSVIISLQLSKSVTLLGIVKCILFFSDFLRIMILWCVHYK